MSSNPTTRTMAFATFFTALQKITTYVMVAAATGICICTRTGPRGTTLANLGHYLYHSYGACIVAEKKLGYVQAIPWLSHQQPAIVCRGALQ